MEVGKGRIYIFLFFCFLVTYSVPGKTAVLPFDSVGMQIVNGKQFLVHQVVAKETHFVLARKYNVPVNQIMAANPHFKKGLAIGALVYIPRKAAYKTGLYKMDAKGNRIHLVAGKQTLFSIARQYQVGPADIKKWNNLSTDGVQVGQTLIVGLAGGAKESKALKESPSDPADTKTATASKTTTIPAPLAVAQPEARTTPVNQIPIPVTRVVQVAESGIAEIINSEGNKYLALHHAAPVGTYITVRNPMNGRTVSARVIGQLPDTGANERIIVKLSKKAQHRLGAIDNRFRVDISYSHVVSE